MSENKHSEQQAVRGEIRKYRVVFVSLVFLTILVVTVSYLRINRILAVIMLLSIAAAKAGLVASYFMHLISEKAAIYSLLVLTAVLIAALLLLPVFGAFKFA